MMAMLWARYVILKPDSSGWGVDFEGDDRDEALEVYSKTPGGVFIDTGTGRGRTTWNKKKGR